VASNSQPDEDLLRSVALQNASSILRARKQAEQELREAQEALRSSEERMRAIFDQAAVGIVIAAMDGKYLEMNRKFCEILGYSERELGEMTFTDITHPDDLDRTGTLVEDLRQGRIDHYALEKRFLQRDGGVIWGRATVTLLRDASGQAHRFIGVIEDITRRKEAEESERHARAAAERASSMKDEFLATLSHELRTPLSAILGWSQVLRARTPSPEDLRRGLETIERNARMQTQLIEDLLDMSRITSGKVRLDVQPVMPSVIIEAALETVRPSADAKGIRLEKMLDPAAGPVSGDPGRLQQVVWNLLSNAIKFTPKDGKVQVLLERVNSHIEISVADTGAGIEPGFIDHAFERFRQADASTTRQYGGLGLGLAIVKNLVELHGGTVRGTSAGPDQGATFTVHLPIAVVHRAKHAQDPARQHPGTVQGIAPDLTSTDLTGVKVLVVDDQVDARELVARVLTDCKAEVFSAGTAEEALRLIELERPDVLVSDIGMPDMDGFELLRRIRALGPERGGRTPAIALTAFARSEDRTRALHRGFQVHCSKPVEPAELIATVASVAGRTGDK
jgi:PAS domain S-box-containing protein